MAKSFDMTPMDTKPIETKYRKIVTKIPVPESVSIIEELRKYEPVSMSGQPLIVWDRGEGFNVFDKYGNKFLDFSSGVLVTNSGHGNPAIIDAIVKIAQHGLLHNYCFPTEHRAKLVKKLVEISPEPLNKAFLLTTGSETTECCIKLARTHGIRVSGTDKIKIVTFHDDFHGRTLGAQMAGGSPKAKEWIVNNDKDMIQVAFPNAFRHEWADESRADYSDENCFAHFLAELEEKGVKPFEIAGIMPETFQGGWVQLMPVGFAKKLREFCTANDIVLIFDEVQSGFGRTGKLFAFQNYGPDVVPDLVCCGKGISSSLPLSAIIGKAEILDLYGPNEMTSTHTGSPVCCEAAFANINYIYENDLIGNSARLGEMAKERILALKDKFSDYIGCVNGIGLAWGIVFVKPGTKEMNPDLAHDVVRLSIENGVLLFAPVGLGATVKLTPPLVINEEAFNEGISVVEEAIAQAIELNR
jgi:4-aminobutyrate aminotransferase/diaminobutyrate-pyruvate transaminase/4-aminobutyrate aminotransferase/(S)-3-amino-2-methylpropionate transaminase